MKILVIYATAGAGHRKAAEAIAQGLACCPDHQVHLVDALDYTSRLYKFVYTRTYTFLISRVSWLWGSLFSILDWRPLLPFIRVLRRIQNTVHAGALARLFLQEQFDAIVATHFFPCEVAAYLKRKGAIASRITCVITDFDVHTIWLSEGVATYTVASDWTKRKVKMLGVREDIIAVTGIPTDSKFSEDKDIGPLKARLGLKQDVMTVLIATGSFGIGPIEEIISRLKNLQLIVVCGHNQGLFKKLNQNKKELVKVCGLVDNMDELMAVSDIMVTKPGGLSISEALVTGLPLVFFNAIPGQEANNVKVLDTYGVGHLCPQVDQIAQILNQFQKHPETMQAAKTRAQLLAKPEAVKDIINIIAA